MGIETILLASTISGAVGTIAQMGQARAAARAQKDAQNTQTNQELVNNRLAQRRAAREERVRRGRLIAASENTGTSGSSGELGALSALGTNTGAAISAQKGEASAAMSISKSNQQLADAQNKFDNIGAFTDLVQDGLSLFDDASTT